MIDIIFDTTKISVLKIPEYTKNLFSITHSIALSLITIFFILSILTETINKSKGKGTISLSNLVIEYIFIIIGLMCYEIIVMKIIAICEAISLALNSQVTLMDFFNGIDKMPEKMAWWRFIKLPIKDGFTFIIKLIFSILTLLSYSIFNIIHFVFLGSVYVIGPFAFMLRIWTPTKKVFANWFDMLFEVSIWPIVFNIFISLILSLYKSMENKPLLILALSTITFLIITASPIIAHMLVKGGGLGHIASSMIKTPAFWAAAPMLASALSLGKTTGSTVMGGIGKGLARIPSAAIPAIKRTFPQWGKKDKGSR
jgi:hypothetical protein